MLLISRLVNSCKTAIRALLLLAIGASAACGTLPASPVVVTPTRLPGYSVDPIFREIYQHYGGEDVLGPPIAAPVIRGQGRSQYFRNVQLEFDPTRPQVSRFSMTPLSLRLMGMDSIPPVAEASLEPKRQDYLIEPSFRTMYELLGHMIGQPLGESRYDTSRRRTTQYFESVGMYRLDGQNEVRLLPLGEWACECAPTAGIMALENNSGERPFPMDATFSDFVEQFGIDFTGHSISPAYFNEQGRWEQIFEAVVLTASAPNDATDIQLRPLARDLHMVFDVPLPSANLPGGQFFPSTLDRGYDIPAHFWAYILAHGGLEVIGAPVSHVAVLSAQRERQCYLNLCLLYDPQAEPALRVHTDATGVIYYTLHYQRLAHNQPVRTLQSAQLAVSELYPLTQPDQIQEIHLRVISQKRPVAGVVAQLTVKMPDGSMQRYTMPPTDPNGSTRLRLAPIDAPTGTLIEYQACLTLADGTPICTEDSYVIWLAP